MSTLQSPVDELRAALEKSSNTMRSMRLQSRIPLGALLDALAARAIRAIEEGLPTLEAEVARRIPTGSVSSGRSSDVVLVHALGETLAQDEDPTVRWLLIAYWLPLCDFDILCSYLEPPVVADPDEVVWLTAAALWVERMSAQPTAWMLRDALERVRAQNPQLDLHVQSQKTREPAHVRDAARMIERLLADSSVVSMESVADAAERGA